MSSKEPRRKDPEEDRPVLPPDEKEGAGISVRSANPLADLWLSAALPGIQKLNQTKGIHLLQVDRRVLMADFNVLLGLPA